MRATIRLRPACVRHFIVGVPMKRWLGLFAIFGLMILGVLVIASLQRSRMTTSERFDLIRIGMTKAQVIAIMGPGDEQESESVPPVRAKQSVGWVFQDEDL